VSPAFSNLREHKKQFQQTRVNLIEAQARRFYYSKLFYRVMGLVENKVPV